MLTQGPALFEYVFSLDDVTETEERSANSRKLMKVFIKGNANCCICWKSGKC